MVHLFHEIQKLEEEAMITPQDFKDLTNNDCRSQQLSVGRGGNMSTITVGSLTTSMNNLGEKVYTSGERSERMPDRLHPLTGKGDGRHSITTQNSTSR